MSEAEDFPPKVHELKRRNEAGEFGANDTPRQPTLEEKVNALRAHDPNLSPQAAIRQVTPDEPRPIQYSKPSLRESLRNSFNNFLHGNRK